MHKNWSKGIYNMEQILNVVKNQVAQLRICKQENDKFQFSVIKSSLVVLLRKWCDTKPIVFVSVNALKEANKKNIDLSKMTWRDQTRFDPKRQIFHYEHKYPISDMINDMLLEIDTIQGVLDNYEVGWILKEEDRRLKSYNRTDHELEYSENGIEIKRFL